MTRPLASYLAPYIADGDPLPDTVTVNAADLLAAVGELRRLREALEPFARVAGEIQEYTKDTAKFYAVDQNISSQPLTVADLRRAAAALAPADG
jgi:hypothetical protein